MRGRQGGGGGASCPRRPRTHARTHARHVDRRVPGDPASAAGSAARRCPRSISGGKKSRVRGREHSLLAVHLIPAPSLPTRGAGQPLNIANQPCSIIPDAEPTLTQIEGRTTPDTIARHWPIGSSSSREGGRRPRRPRRIWESEPKEGGPILRRHLPPPFLCTMHARVSAGETAPQRTGSSRGLTTVPVQFSPHNTMHQSRSIVIIRTSLATE